MRDEAITTHDSVQLCLRFPAIYIVNKKDVFCWLQNYVTRVTHTRHPSMEYQTLMFVLLKYGVPLSKMQELRVPWGISGHRVLPDSRLYRNVMHAFDLNP